MSRGIKKPSPRLYLTLGQRHAALVFCRLSCVSVGKVPPDRGRCLGVERWVRSVFWLSTISYPHLFSSVFNPWLTRTLHSRQVGSLYHCSCKTPRSAISPGRAAPPLTNICWNFLSDDNPLSLFFIVLNLDFLFLYCNWKGSQEGEGSAHVLSLPPCSRNPVIILIPLMMVDYCTKETGHWAKYISTPKYYLEFI